MTVRSVSYGGGVQSTALLVLAAQGHIDFDLFLFANVGDDSEHPESLRYMREVAVPYGQAHGIDVVELQKRKRDGSLDTLLSTLMRGQRSIPMRREKDGPPMSRSCTANFKVAVIGKELRRRGATAEDPAVVALGISVDELERAREGTDPRSPWQARVYPLLTLGMHRNDCHRVITEAGLPTPPKSACWFCPFHDREAWRALRRDTPELFDAACHLEATMTADAPDGRPVFLTRKGVPLADTLDDQLVLDGMDGCDSGWCMT